MKFAIAFLVSSLAAITSSSPTALGIQERAGVSVTEGKGWYVYANANPFVALSSGQTFYFQNDGNFVAYYGSNVLFASGTGGHSCPTGSSACQLIFQNDGNLVVYINGAALWSSKTANTGQTLSFNNGDVIDVYNSAGKVVYCSDCVGGGCKRDLNGALLDPRCISS